MRIGIRKGTRTLLILVVLAFCGWWWVRSWTAYRHVAPSAKMAILDAKGDAWFKGVMEMNEYMTFKHYPVFLCCAVILAVLGLLPEHIDYEKKK
jgi:hypothetical protein